LISWKFYFFIPLHYTSIAINTINFQKYPKVECNWTDLEQFFVNPMSELMNFQLVQFMVFFQKRNRTKLTSLIRFGSVTLIGFSDVFHALFFSFQISHISLIRYVSATILTFVLSIIIQQTFLIPHSFRLCLYSCQLFLLVIRNQI
jgi:hypothetical protein